MSQHLFTLQPTLIIVDVQKESQLLPSSVSVCTICDVLASVVYSKNKVKHNSIRNKIIPMYKKSVINGTI